eukprot:TRINITY_DN5838_c4_g1_i1.p1 TRINITY_DN5838_c4_g1~~TRINITY_DN5838_c4_g1_i1.p1  ORF type:complete len:61 (-),score=1.11 TRINITY_DN5838_c4_g1_i1:121-303(-)
MYIIVHFSPVIFLFSRNCFDNLLLISCIPTYRPSHKTSYICPQANIESLYVVVVALRQGM